MRLETSNHLRDACGAVSCRSALESGSDLRTPTTQPRTQQSIVAPRQLHSKFIFTLIWAAHITSEFKPNIPCHSYQTATPQTLLVVFIMKVCLHNFRIVITITLSVLCCTVFGRSICANCSLPPLWFSRCSAPSARGPLAHLPESAQSRPAPRFWLMVAQRRIPPCVLVVAQQPAGDEVIKPLMK